MHKMRTAKWVDFFISGKEDRLFLLAIKPNYAIIKTGQWANSAGQAPSGADLSSLLSTLQGSPSGANAPAISMDTILKIQRTMQALSRSNPNIDLLRAMRPLLSPRRARKVDDAIRIMQLIQLLPALKESGLFALGGDSQ